jgi:hypothetical protein
MAIVRAALVQATWTGDQESMISHHEEQARLAAAAGAQVICFRELFCVIGSVSITSSGSVSFVTSASTSSPGTFNMTDRAGGDHA